MLYKVQLLTASAERLVDGLYLVQAASPAVLDGVAKGLIGKTLHAHDYIHEALDPAFKLPATIKLGNPDTLALGRDLTYDADLAKIDWDS